MWSGGFIVESEGPQGIMILLVMIANYLVPFWRADEEVLLLKERVERSSNVPAQDPSLSVDKKDADTGWRRQIIRLLRQNNLRMTKIL